MQSTSYLTRSPRQPTKRRPRRKRLGKILAIDAVVGVPVFLPLEIAADLHDAIEVEPGAAEDAAEILVGAAGLVVERIVNDLRRSRRPTPCRRRTQSRRRECLARTAARLLMMPGPRMGVMSLGIADGTYCGG